MSRNGVKKRGAVTNNIDMESQATFANNQQVKGGLYNGVYYDDYGRPVTHGPSHYNDGYHYHGWGFSARNLCWGLLWLIGFAMLVLGLIGFIVAVINAGSINTLETSVSSIMMTDQAQQAILDALTVPFDHTSAGPLTVNKAIQYINVGAIAAMTLPGDLSSYLNNQICVISKTAFAHTVTMAAGATWNGADTIATFGGAVGDGFCFTVFSATQAHVTSAANVVFS